MKIDIDLAAFFVEMYNRENGSKRCIEFLIDSKVPKMIMLKTYTDFIKEETFLIIELLENEEKIKLADKCRSTGLKFNNESLRDAARILYTLEFINGNT